MFAQPFWRVSSSMTDEPDKQSDAKPSTKLTWGVKIPMRDGLHLNGTLYRPAEMEGILPVIFTMTPYISDTYHERGMYFSQNGYVFVIVDVRGRGNSEGEFNPFVNDAHDGYDAVEWLAEQSWCDGKVAMWGGSYAGFNQWTTLKEFPPHLETIVPAAAVCPGVDFPVFKNILISYVMKWITFTSGVTPNANLFGEAKFWIDRFRELYLNHLPFNKLDEVVGNPSSVFQTWLQHPAGDEYWETLLPSAAQYKRIEIPILSITGHYDGDQPGAMNFYRMHKRHGADDARAKHYLLIGPWDHPGTRTPNKKFGGLEFGEASIVDLNELHKEWYDWTMKDGEKPEFLKGHVAYYVADADEWKYADSLEAIATTARKLYLNSTNSQANDIFHSGMLSEHRVEVSEPDSYTYDPLDVRPEELERESIEEYLIDQRYTLNLFESGLVYHSEPFAEQTELTGNIRCVLWFEIDVPDTDFFVAVQEVLPDGRSVHLVTDLMRARYRKSLQQEKLITPGEVNCYQFDAFTFTSRRLAKGSRLRLVITAPNSIYFQKNYNSGGVVAEESKEDARTAHVRLYHDAEYPSYLEIPLVQETEAADHPL